MAVVTESGAETGSAEVAGAAVMRRGWQPYWVSGALAVTASLGCLLTFLVPGILRGAPVMNGSARGTVLAVLLAGVPLLVLSMVGAARGSGRAVVLWLGAAAFATYNSVMLVFSTPFNRLFLLYVGMLALSVWSVGTLLAATDVASLARRFAPTAHIRPVAVYAWIIITLNAGAWLMKILPAITRTGGPEEMLRGTGLTTNVVYVQDLALWLPLSAVAAAWLWQRRPWGYLLLGGALVAWVLESVSIAIDQAYGHAADPASTVASAALTPAFAALALIGLIPLWYLLRSLREDGPGIAGRLAWRRTAAPHRPSLP